ncbi:hypothetical protein [Planococcus halotolerans]|uniref:Uncharacterized protein n=1 Tax=Planococcus halotolerans TaxID=2233542 RepID=A0A365L750_9BACL|nr:hypothetical protein [Planococcus halotolerans]RAZ81256.1 hypothetical protein DP120_02930 [Planococcus halotolerans]
MLKSKITMAVGSVIGIFVVVYGTALLLGLLFDAYLFEGGLTNLNYGLLALLCALPFAVIAMVGRNGDENKRALIISTLLFSILFVLVHLVLVLSAEVMDAGRILVIFPVSALLLAVVSYFTTGKEKAV